MKQIIAFALVFVLCMTMCACQNTENTETQPSKTPDNHNSDTKPAEDESAPGNDTTDPTQAPTEPEKTDTVPVKEIVITTENWQEYLELKQVVEWREHGCMITFALGLKDAYADRTVSAETTLDIEWSGTWFSRELSSNTENKTFEIGEIIEGEPVEEVTKQSSFHPNLLTLEHYIQQHAIVVIAGKTGYSRYVKTVEDFAVISASGTIRFE